MSKRTSHQKARSSQLKHDNFLLNHGSLKWEEAKRPCVLMEVGTNMQLGGPLPGSACGNWAYWTSHAGEGADSGEKWSDGVRLDIHGTRVSVFPPVYAHRGLQSACILFIF